MTGKYLDLLEKILSAYTREHMERYFAEVRRDGLTEHGFPRLTANIGILIAHGRRQDLLPLFLDMMDFCCATIPKVKAANDFSVREIVCCIRELEGGTVVGEERLGQWKTELSAIDPRTCYNSFAEKPTDPVRNWALFSGVSEFYRQEMGLCDSSEFIDIQIAANLRWLDENGMYMDNEAEENHQPMVYDLVPRGLFMLLLHRGYRGKYYETLDALLRKTALLQLKMQSVTGELPFGGRSNQFLHNEAWVTALCEYEAARYRREGNTALAGRFKAAAEKAIANTWYWLNREPISHVKNRFDPADRFGCEDYAYFDKYMITAASFYYAASLFCDDSVEPVEGGDEPMLWQTSPQFHKLFAKAGGYALEFDLDGDPHYDASGLGRVHREGAPSPICLSLPCPGHPGITLFGAKPMAASLCPGVDRDGQRIWGAEACCRWETGKLTEGADYAAAELRCIFPDGSGVDALYRVDETGVTVENRGSGKLFYLLPAFAFDGERETVIACDGKTLTVSFEGWVCRYTTDGVITDTGRTAPNRNGHYRIFCAEGTDALGVKIGITK